MKTLFALLLLTVPAGAFATPIIVEYEGVVAEVDDICLCTDSGYEVGDRIAGVLTIDADHAPPNFYTDPSDRGTYGIAYDFVSGNGKPFEVTSNHDTWGDQVVLTDRHTPDTPLDLFSVQDFFRPAGGGRGELRLSAFSPTAGAPAVEFIQGNSLAQSFSLEATEGLRLEGRLRRVLRTGSYAVLFAISKLTVRPGSCHG